MTMSQPIYPGIDVVLGGRPFVIPPLSLGQVRRFQAKLAEWTASADDKSIEVCIDVVHSALSRNYPDLTRDEVAELVDLGNMVELMRFVMDMSGMVRKAMQEKKTPTSH